MRMWELMNEPRNYADSSGNTLQAWIDEMSAFVKSIDSRHLLSVGSEGFFGRSSYQGYQDIAGSWALATGVDSLRNSAGANIDFATTHIYTDSWWPRNTFTDQMSRFNRLNKGHDWESFAMLGKPIVLTEFGKRDKNWVDMSRRDNMLSTAFYDVYQSAVNYRAFFGAVLWMLAGDKQPNPGGFYVYSPSSVWPKHDTVLKTIKTGSHRLFDKARVPAVVPIFFDRVYYGWSDWSWDIDIDFQQTFVGQTGIRTATGRRSVYVKHKSAGSALRLRTQTWFTSYATTLSFSIYGSWNGVHVQLMTDKNHKSQQASIWQGSSVIDLPSGFKQIRMPLQQLSYNGVWNSVAFQVVGTNDKPYYLMDISISKNSWP